MPLLRSGRCGSPDSFAELVLQLQFSRKEWEYRRHGRRTNAASIAAWTGGRDQQRGTAMRKSLRIALAASAAMLICRRGTCSGTEPEDRHRRRLSALQQPDRRRQARRLRHRHRQCALRGDEGEVRIRRAGLARHHPGAAGRQVRRHHRLDVDHRRAQAAGRLHRQVLQHAAGHRGAQGHRHQGRDQGGSRRQDDRRRRLDHAFQLLDRDLHRQHDQGLSEQPGVHARSRQRPPRRRQ